MGYDYSVTLNANSNNFNIYDEYGNLIKKKKTDEEKTGEMNEVALKALDEKNDEFVKEATVKEAEQVETKKVAKANKNKITTNFKAFNVFMNSFASFGQDFQSELKIDNEALAREVSDLNQLAKKLTSTHISNTTVIESTKQFQEKLNKAEHDIKNHTDKTSAEEDESVLTLETAKDNYDKANKIEVKEAETYLSNNPFFASAMETSVIEEDEEVEV